MIILELNRVSLPSWHFFFNLLFLPLCKQPRSSVSPVLSVCRAVLVPLSSVSPVLSAALCCHISPLRVAHLTRQPGGRFRRRCSFELARTVSLPSSFLALLCFILNHFPWFQELLLEGLILWVACNALFQLLFFWKSLYFVFLLCMKFWAGIFGLFTFFEKFINVLHYLLALFIFCWR